MKGLFQRIKVAANKAEALHSPAKKISTHYVDITFKWICATTPLLLAFPLNRRSLSIELVAAALIVTIPLILSRRKGKVSVLSFWVSLLTLLLFCSICPFVAAPKPVYISILDT